jgi:hypothetical protein
MLDMEEHGPVPDRLLCNAAAFESPASEGLVVSDTIYNVLYHKIDGDVGFCVSYG